MEVTAYSGGTGINNKIKPHRLPYDPETGVSAFEDAEDVIIDSTGGAVARRGTTEIESGEYHSLFPGNDWGLVAKNRTSDTALYRVDVSGTNTTLTGVQSGFTKGAKFDFCRVGDAIFYTNGFGIGMITSDCFFVDWKESSRTSTKNFVDIPVSEHLCYNAGRIFFSLDDMIYYTEFGHLGLFNHAINGERFLSKVLVMAPVTDGLYISDRNAVYFLAGLNPKEWKSRKVLDYPAKEWGKYHGTVNPYLLGFDTNIPSTVLATKNGPVLCLPSGNIENLIERNIVMPDCPEVGAIAVFDETLIIQTGE